MRRLDALQLVNAAHPCPGGPLLEELVDVGGGVCLASEAAGALAALLDKIQAAGRIVPVSGWRSEAEQQALWRQSEADNGLPFTEQYVARPGCSEHQTGLAIDVALAEDGEPIDFIRPYFPYDGLAGRFRFYAADYGFVERYPAGKEAVTGIAHEPWHFRFVGRRHALAMVRAGQCLEEYPYARR